MNKYYRILDKILATGKTQTNKKGNIQYLLNEQLSLTPADLLDIFEGHNIARKKLRSELQLFMQGERNVEKYREGRHQLVGLLRLHPGEQLPDLFREAAPVDSEN